MIKRMGRVLIYGKLVTNILDNSKMIIGMDMERCIGETELYIKESGQMEFN